jgi:RNA polymerase sigma factor (TIGR02999 family)
MTASSPAQNASDTTSLTQLLRLAANGDGKAWDSAFAQVYSELKLIARKLMSKHGPDTLSPTGLVHECYLRLANGAMANVTDRGHFHALAARAMRFVLINRARDRSTQKRNSGMSALTLTDDAIAANQQLDSEAEELLMLDQAMQQLEKENPQWVRVLECRIFAGLSEEESSQALQMSLRSLQRGFADAKKRIGELLAS